MFEAPSGKTYIRGRTLRLPSGLSTSSCINAAISEGFSTLFPRSSRRAGQGRGARAGDQCQCSGRGHSRRVALGSATRQGCPSSGERFARNENARRNLASVASNANASTSVVTFGLVAPSGKTYITAGPGPCLEGYPRVSNLAGPYHGRCPQSSHGPSHLTPRHNLVTPRVATPRYPPETGSPARRARVLPRRRALQVHATRSSPGRRRRCRSPPSLRPRIQKGLR
jgi:hypothetical protein